MGFNDEFQYYSETHHNLPLKDYKKFIGRIEQLKRLNSYIVESRFRFIVVSGEGGIGKTTLVSEYVHQLLESHDFHSIVWSTAKAKKLEVKSWESWKNVKPYIRRTGQKTDLAKKGVWVESVDDLLELILAVSDNPNYQRHVL